MRLKKGKQAVANFDISVSGFSSGIPTFILGNGDNPQNLTVTLNKSKLADGEIVVELEGNF